MNERVDLYIYLRNTKVGTSLLSSLTWGEWIIIIFISFYHFMFLSSVASHFNSIWRRVKKKWLCDLTQQWSQNTRCNTSVNQSAVVMVLFILLLFLSDFYCFLQYLFLLCIIFLGFLFHFVGLAHRWVIRALDFDSVTGSGLEARLESMFSLENQN